VSYACWLYINDFRKDAELEWERFVELPFPPYKGMCLQFSDDDDASGWDYSPYHVVYLVSKGVFLCHARESCFDCPCQPREKCCLADAEHMAWGRDGGWTLTSERRGKERHFVFPKMRSPRPPDGIPIQ
jgi:hypothetical protein